MDSSSHIFGGEEECHSSESGWTMYIGSPVEGGEDDDYTDGGAGASAAENFHKDNWETNHQDANSDDSMASDASSGPSLREKAWESKKGGRLEPSKVVVDRNHSSKHKEKKPAAAVKKNKHQEKDAAKGNKVRKNLGWGKQK